MPGCFRFSSEGVLREIESAQKEGICSVVLFPAIEDSKKTSDAKEAFNPDGLIPQVISKIKKSFPDVVVITDVALDPYSSDGHDGLVSIQGDILNDQTLEVLVEQALSHARAGADVVAPSDMMDGRVGVIREALDVEGYADIGIMSYTAKYASAFYGPFRGALDSAPRGGDKKTYQMDPRNVREALRELELDEMEGADIVMVKPAGAYLDVIREIRENTSLPIAAYQVSGEYLMIKTAAASGWIDEQKAVIESLIAIRRAGADMILTYFARSAAKWIS
jgi:porphobilinogen synthase